RIRIGRSRSRIWLAHGRHPCVIIVPPAESCSPSAASQHRDAESLLVSGSYGNKEPDSPLAMTPPERLMSALRVRREFLHVAVVAAACLYAPGLVPSVDARGQQPAALLADRPIERQLGHGDLHRYPLTIAAGDYVRVVVEQRGIDVVVQVLDPAGAIVTEFQ